MSLSHHKRTISDFETYTKAELCEIFECSMQRLNVHLAEVGVPVLCENTKFATVNGYVYNRCVVRKQMECLDNLRIKMDE